MALDGITVSNIIYELKDKLIGGRIDKVYQPEKDEIFLSVRSLGNNYKLLFTANASSPRVNITNQKKENPMKAPLFCMVLRKHIIGGKITAISQPNFERIIVFDIEAANEMGDFCTRKLIIEIMGKHSNIILVGDDNNILDSIKHISFETSSVREVLPGKEYVYPPSKDKINPLTCPIDIFDEKISSNDTLKVQSMIYQSYNGISPVMASEICFRANIDPYLYCNQLNGDQGQALSHEFGKLVKDILDAKYLCKTYYDDTGKLFEFSSVLMTQFSEYSSKDFESISELLEFFYSEKDLYYRINQKSHDLKKLIQTNIDRCVKKSDLQQKILKDIENRDTYRVYGELITANIYSVEKGSKSLTVQNFYDENLAEITIPIDPNKTASENAQRYFNRYNKGKRTFVAMQDQIKQNQDEFSYLESVMVSMQNALDESDIEQIRNELVDEGFAKKKKAKKGTQRKITSKPYCYLSSDGFYIYVGKNNKQNDELTLKFATGNDMWFHTKDIPGSHVIVKTEGKEVPNQTLTEAALLSAYYSKAKNSSLVPVDYTQKKNVKKPSGAKPGMVIYETNKTAYVTPDEEAISKLKLVD